jgi:hypothetical protein
VDTLAANGPTCRLNRDAFINHLYGEKALADKGYQDNYYFVNPNGDQMKKISQDTKQ